MALIMPFVSVAVSILYTPFLLFILCIIFLASIGKSLGVRRLYVNILLKLFEYGRQHIEVAKKLQRSDSSDEEEPLVPDDKPPSAIIKENGVNGTKTTVIERQEILGPSPELNYRRVQNGHKAEQGNGETNLEFHFYHCMDLVKAGMESIIEDQVTSVFEAEELRSWNLLTRTNRQYEFLTWRLTIIWMMGFVVRYFFLLPLRILIFVIGIGQRHDGFLGLLQRALARASPHIWFERSEVKDRHAVARRLKEHISVPDNPPILIFPEGTCINNTSVMQFKKGSFEVGGTIYPVAIKYDPRFGDAFWNSSRYGMLHYLLNMMSSWAIVCDVWYLPPMHRYNNETAVDFANRVKAVVARRGGLVDLMWDGQLKRMKAKKEWRELQQEEFSKRLKGE
ncbi:PREDICTED: glycerol-3-phosphate acyltransferase 4 isoform X4 [Papilio xuthus]|uniref:Glycerol-3-phosphate acyltransferase 4 isoform X4 n=1 Tax=Papilio xuthus TaxID=66420 RepID=A0AAJ6ZKP6_PAPXU|nr:PREDICTED: glycerol-3-phosphate acyltransferase 4 isoform X4 [Papilio xuthus]